MLSCDSDHEQLPLTYCELSRLNRPSWTDQEVKGLIDDDQNEKDSFLSGIMSGQIHPSTQEEEICCGARRKISINPPCKSLILAYSVS